MRKSFICAVYCIFVLIALRYCDSWTFLLFLCVLILIFPIVYSCFQLDPSYRCCVKKPGTVSFSRSYITKTKVTKSLDNYYLSQLGRYSYNSLNQSASKPLLNKSPLKKLDRSVSFKSYSSITKTCQTDMSYLRSSSTSIGLFDYSPVRRHPLHSRNSVDNVEDNSCISPIRRTQAREIADDSGGVLTPRSTRLANDGGSPNDTMSVGEFPLISLVSSIHQAVSPKSPRLKPSPVTIRIQPIQSPEPVNECHVDPVVSVLKQIASKKRILGPSTGPSIDDKQKEKKARSIPRHDLTHSLLESQLTINSGREGVSSKREREESHCPTLSPNGTPSGTAPKRMCARTLRSNEILSSLSSSVTLTSPTTNKSFTGKRKNITFDKYKKMRKLEEAMKEAKSDDPSPSKADKAVTAEEPVEKKSSPLPIITIKRDEISERVVSRAMVSALLKSTVAKLIMSGDPAVYPVPNGTQPRQPEVTTPDFGPPKTITPPISTILTTTPVSSGLLNLPGVSSTPTSNFSFGLQTPKSVASTSSTLVPITSQPTVTGFNFGQQTSGGSSAISQTVTSSVQSPSSTSGATVQTSFSLTKPQMSVSSVPSVPVPSVLVPSVPVPSVPVPSVPVPSVPVPSFGLGTPSSTFVTTTTSSTPQLGGISTPSSTIPSFGLATTTLTTSSSSNSSQATVIPKIKNPSSSNQYWLTSPSDTTKISSPTFGLTSGSTVTTAPSAPSFSFGNTTSPSITKATTSAPPPPIFGSIVASSTAPSTFSLPTSSVPTSSSNLFTSKSTVLPSVPVFGSLTAPVASTTTSASTATFGSGMTTSVATTTAASTNTPTFVPSLLTSTSTAFGSNTATSNSNPIFGGSLVTSSANPLLGTSAPISTPIFGSANNAITSASNVFGGAHSTTSTPTFGSNTTTVTTSAPLFGSVTTASTSSAPVFGSFTNVNPVTASNSIFGGINTTPNSTAPIFGGGNTSTSNPIFGSSATTTTSSTPFGTSTNTSTPLFGSVPVATTTAPPLFGASTSATSSATPLFGGTSVSTATSAPIFGGGSTSFSSTSGFGGSSTAKTEGLFGMPSSNSGFKATSPFQVGGGDNASTVPAFGASTPQVKPFEFGGSKPSSGGFTFKPSGPTTTPFSSQPVSAPNTSFTAQPPSQTPFSFTGSGSAAPAGQTSGNSPFVFGSATGSNNNTTVTAVKPFQFGSSSTPSVTPTFGTSAAPTSTPAFGQSFTPTFGQPAAGNQPPPFGQTSSSPAPNAFQFNAAPPAAPGPTGGGLFSIGTGSSGTRSRDRRDRRRRV